MQKFRLLVLIVLSLSTAFTNASGQTQTSQPPNPSDWETLRPEGEEFTVLMPKGSSFASGKEPYHKMEINTRTYLSQTAGGPVLAVVSLSGIKSNPAMYSETQRVNSYVDAFKTLFTPKLKKTTPAKLHFVRNKNLMGHAGREYDMTVGDLSGKVHAFATRKRFYALVYLNNKKDDQIQEQFLSSFVLPEKIEIQPPAPTVTKSSPAPGQPGSESTPATATHQPAKEGSENSAPGTKPDAAAPADPAGKRPIRGGVLNGKAITLPKPIYPAGTEVSGTVTVEVTIDEYGSVSSARAVSGHLQLQQAAIDAALQARFSPNLSNGRTCKSERRDYLQLRPTAIGVMNRSLKRLDGVHQRLMNTVAPLDTRIFTRRPSESEWSVAEIVQHLCLVEERVIKDLKRAIKAEPGR